MLPIQAEGIEEGGHTYTPLKHFPPPFLLHFFPHPPSWRLQAKRAGVAALAVGERPEVSAVIFFPSLFFDTHPPSWGLQPTQAGAAALALGEWPEVDARRCKLGEGENGVGGDVVVNYRHRHACIVRSIQQKTETRSNQEWTRVRKPLVRQSAMMVMHACVH